jgi:hypothetical protein
MTRTRNKPRRRIRSYQVWEQRNGPLVEVVQTKYKCVWYRVLHSRGKPATCEPAVCFRKDFTYIRDKP